jgi:hypothetical protein
LSDSRASSSEWQSLRLFAAKHVLVPAGTRQHGSMAALQRGNTAARQHGNAAAWQHGKLSSHIGMVMLLPGSSICLSLTGSFLLLRWD